MFQLRSCCYSFDFVAKIEMNSIYLCRFEGLLNTSKLKTYFDQHCWAHFRRFFYSALKPSRTDKPLRF